MMMVWGFSAMATASFAAASGRQRKATSALLALPAEQYGAERKAAAARIRQFTTDENMQKWLILAVDLEKITEKVQKNEKKP